MKYRLLKRKNGVSLALALMFVGLTVGMLSVIAVFSTRGQEEQRAAIAGSEAIEAARAAVAFVQKIQGNYDKIDADNDGDGDIRFDSLKSYKMLQSTSPSVEYPNLVTQLAQNGPIVIDPQDLKNSSFLRETFGAANALGQDIHIIMANFPVNGDPGDPAQFVVPTAYVFFENTTGRNQKMASIMAETARGQGVPVMAPLFDDDGSNLAGNCMVNGADTGPAITEWDSGTGCMGEDDFVDLVSTVDGGAIDEFEAGSFLMPAWHTVHYDSRALSRFPIPDNPSSQTMMTDMLLADCSGGSNITKTIGSGATRVVIRTDICESVRDGIPDSEGELNRRFNIRDVGTMRAVSFLADTQSVDEVGDDLGVDERYSIGVDSAEISSARGGDVLVSQLDTSGSIDVPGHVSVNNKGVRVKKNVVVEDGAASSLKLPGRFTVKERVSPAGEIKVGGNFNLDGFDTIKIDDQVIVQSIKIKNAGSSSRDMNISVQNADLLGSTATDSLKITGDNDTNSYDFVAGSLITEKFKSEGKINASEGVIRGKTNLSSEGGTSKIHVKSESGSENPARCFGDCPKRDLFKICKQMGIDADNCEGL